MVQLLNSNAAIMLIACIVGYETLKGVEEDIDREARPATGTLIIAVVGLAIYNIIPSHLLTAIIMIAAAVITIGRALAGKGKLEFIAALEAGLWVPTLVKILGQAPGYEVGLSTKAIFSDALLIAQIIFGLVMSRIVDKPAEDREDKPRKERKKLFGRRPKATSRPISGGGDSETVPPADEDDSSARAASLAIPPANGNNDNKGDKLKPYQIIIGIGLIALILMTVGFTVLGIFLYIPQP